MATNRTVLTAYLLRTSVAWALRQLMGLLAIVASVVLLVGVANVAEALSARWAWGVLGTVLSLLAWVGATAIAFYALTRLLRLRRDRSLALWALLGVVYGLVVWIAGGLPLVPAPFAHPPPAVSAAERPLMLVEAGGALNLGASAEQTVPRSTPTALSRIATAMPVPTQRPVEVNTNTPLWARNVDEAPLFLAAAGDEEPLTRVPPGAIFRILSASDSRYQVYYGGDRARRRAGEAWVDKTLVSASAWPQFVRPRVPLSLLEEPRRGSREITVIPSGGYLEVLQGGPGEWARVLYLGDGRDGGPHVGWVGAAALTPTDVEPGRITRFLATAASLARPPEVWLKVPYRSQLDGSAWALANCGPTSVAMMLEAYGIQVPSADLRRRVMANQRTPNCHECGSFIEALSAAAEQFGLKSLDLQTADGKLKRWSLDEVRAALRAGHPVLPQVMFRHLPGREDSPYYGDHYVVLTGLLGEDFLYNDPIDDGPGYGRLIRADQLRRAMAASDFPFAAFATTLP